MEIEKEKERNERKVQNKEDDRDKYYSNIVWHKAHIVQ